MALTHSLPVSYRPPLPTAFPGPPGRRSARSPGFRRASGTIRLSDCSPCILSHFASRLIGSVIPSATRKHVEPSWGHGSSVPCRSHNTLVSHGWVKERTSPSDAGSTSEWTFLVSRRVEPVNKSPRTVTSGSFPQGTLPQRPLLTHCLSHVSGHLCQPTSPAHPAAAYPRSPGFHPGFRYIFGCPIARRASFPTSPLGL